MTNAVEDKTVGTEDRKEDSDHEVQVSEEEIFGRKVLALLHFLLKFFLQLFNKTLSICLYCINLNIKNSYASILNLTDVADSIERYSISILNEGVN
ncbi:unnamed protein product [Rhizophagus irregularis]|nr:unnamed protein product [Rhizophagus irregularis]